MINPTKGKLILYLVLLFMAGAVTGSVITYGTLQKSKWGGPPRPPGDIVAHLKQKFQIRLDLTPDQAARINPMVEQAGVALRAAHDDSTKQFAHIFDDLNAQVAGVLTPEQKKKLEEMQREHREWENRRFRKDSNAPSHIRPEAIPATK
jgi:Spy/CpxP family protein refolding chaperone